MSPKAGDSKILVKRGKSTVNPLLNPRPKTGDGKKKKATCSQFYSSMVRCILDFAHFTPRNMHYAQAERGLSAEVKWHQGFEVMPKNQSHPKDADERQRAHH